MKKSERILKRLVKGRDQFHAWNWKESQSIKNDQYINALILVFGSRADTAGWALECLVCGKSLPAQVPRDLDAWFCSSCCPVCN